MNNGNHYFIKLGEKNYLFDFFKNREKELGYHLIIGHGDWKCADYNHGANNNLIYSKKDSTFVEKNVKNQIDAFYNQNQYRENSYCWLFHEQKIYVFQSDSDIYDLKDYPCSKFKEFCNVIKTWNRDTDYKLTRPNQFNLWHNAKLCKARLLLTLESYDVIHQFSSTNANRGYNSKTIIKLKDNLSNTAEDILSIKLKNGSNKDLPDSFEKRLKYLSPIQFETLVFLVLYELGYLPSNYRGGTGKDHDILINNNNETLSKKLDGINYISVKLNSSQTYSKLLPGTIYVFGIIDDKPPSKSFLNINILELFNDLENNKKEKIKKWISCQIKNLLPFYNPE